MIDVKRIQEVTDEVPAHLSDIHYEVIMGSVAYGVSTNMSDVDIYSFAIPQKEVVYPHLTGYIGFGLKPNFSDSFQKHHIMKGEQEYDVNVYNVVKYFQLVAENNPNMIDSLFVPDDCLIHLSPKAKLVRDNRDLFLSKKIYHTYSGYAFAQLSKLEKKTYENSKRKSDVEENGYSTKNAYHTIRLLDQGIYALEHTTMNLRLDNTDLLKEIRTGKYTLGEIKEIARGKEQKLKTVYEQSTLQYAPDWKKLNDLLHELVD